MQCPFPSWVQQNSGRSLWALRWNVVDRPLCQWATRTYHSSPDTCDCRFHVAPREVLGSCYTCIKSVMSSTVRAVVTKVTGFRGPTYLGCWTFHVCCSSSDPPLLKGTISVAVCDAHLWQACSQMWQAMPILEFWCAAAGGLEIGVLQFTHLSGYPSLRFWKFDLK